MAKIIVRHAKKPDIKKIAELFRKESSRKPYSEKWTEKTAVKKIRLYFKENAIFVALNKNEIVGFIVGHIFLFWDGRNGFVDEIFVAREHQNKGIGSSLLQRLEAYFKKKRVAVISLGANEKSKAYDFYKKRGYKYEKFKILFKRLE